jgi:hypothetical protein
VRLINASSPSRATSVATTNNPALATRFGSSKVASIRSIACDTHWKCHLALVTTTTSNTVIVPAQEAFFRGYAAPLSRYSSEDRG